MSQFRFGPPFSTLKPFSDFRQARDGGWAVARLNPNTGQIVLQLGGQPPKSTPDALFAGAGFEGLFTISKAGNYIFSAVFDVGPVSMLPRGFTAATQIIYGIDRIGGDDDSFFPPPQGVIGANFGTHNLVFSAQLDPATYMISVAAGAMINYSGTPNPAPYAEIITTCRSAIEISPDTLAKAAQPAAFPARSAQKQRDVREMTDAEMAAEGTIVFKSH